MIVDSSITRSISGLDTYSKDVSKFELSTVLQDFGYSLFWWVYDVVTRFVSPSRLK